MNILNTMLTVCTNLLHLTFDESVCKRVVPLMFEYSPPSTFRSSSLVKLNVRVDCFEDCLYLLGGRFVQLHTLCVDLAHISHTPEQDVQLPSQVGFNRNISIRRTKKSNNFLENDLANMKHFSLSCYNATDGFDDLILPLLYRLSNIEELHLYLTLLVLQDLSMEII